jgi:hypothetical protein
MRLGLLLLCAVALSAQPPQHTVAEVLETTYRVLDNGAAEITQHQRLRALTAQGRDAISKVQIPFPARSKKSSSDPSGR